MVEQAITSDAGIGLINGTQTLLSWTTPNDGLLHSFVVAAILFVASNQTGGVIQIQCTTGGQAVGVTIFAGGLASPTHGPSAPTTLTCDPNTTVTVKQTTAQTAGSSFFYGSIFGL